MLFQSLLYCSNSWTLLHFKTLISHTKTLKIRYYMFRSHLKPSSDIYDSGLDNSCLMGGFYITEWTDIQPHSDTLYNNYKSTFQFSNLAKYSHGPPEDGFKGDRNTWGRILSILVWEFSVLKYSDVRELEQ